MEHLRRDEKRLPLGAVDPEASLLGDNQFPWPYDVRMRSTSHARAPSPHSSWPHRSPCELTATSTRNWPDGQPINSVGEFTCQPGVLIRKRPALTTQQRITSSQDEGQCVASVTSKYRVKRAQIDMEADRKEVEALEWDLKPQDDLYTRLMKTKDSRK
mmetsp:Transcript_15760/g.30222  ORF Transcript_15760/g.30222 Transcript_15760/m.30222 type:complete len:158 (+) Transcript_15760:255-728(+)|eukprot:CAMPEP_0114237928 /NCGR_PEP_ID=MMETSP0058-20121206/7654_1 /TAXON_ID=36894 /ORGANISM="Pyramimonas parkeae, CCMP726" /LENGTH=157 /DNA_ID=CAMNT_0001350007 /DNA_START=209 /DNA_END=682 /DNA_ORIENTATION=+